MPPLNTRHYRADVELCGRVAKALGWKAKRVGKKVKRDKDKKVIKRQYAFEIKTPWGTTTITVDKDDPNFAIQEAAPAFHESFDDLMLAWLGRKAVHHDFEFSLRVIRKKGAQWAVYVTTPKIKKVFKRSVEGFPSSRPIAEAVDYVYREILNAD